MTIVVIKTLRGYSKSIKNPPTAFKQSADQFGVILYQHSIWQASKEV
jgi:hypothetical protein